MRVHHRNLASIVGYCNEGGNMGIVFEYMAYGNLEDYLSGTNHVYQKGISFLLKQEIKKKKKLNNRIFVKMLRLQTKQKKS